MEKPGYKAHVFICTHHRDPSTGKESCAARGSQALLDTVKAAAKTQYGKDVRVNKSGCMDYCSRGIACVIYPQNEWHLDVQKDDADRILSAIDRAVSKT